MNFLFDNNTSPILANIVDGYVRHEGHRAFHIKEESGHTLGINRNAKDVEWISALGRDARVWVVVTADRRISTVPAEKEAFRRAKLKGILLLPGYRKMPVNKIGSLLLWRWPELVETIDRFGPPALIGVPPSKSGKLTQIRW